MTSSSGTPASLSSRHAINNIRRVNTIVMTTLSEAIRHDVFVLSSITRRARLFGVMLINQNYFEKMRCDIAYCARVYLQLRICTCRLQPAAQDNNMNGERRRFQDSRLSTYLRTISFYHWSIHGPKLLNMKNLCHGPAADHSI